MGFLFSFVICHFQDLIYSVINKLQIPFLSRRQYIKNKHFINEVGMYQLYKYLNKCSNLEYRELRAFGYSDWHHLERSESQFLELSEDKTFKICFSGCVFQILQDSKLLPCRRLDLLSQLNFN